MLEFKTFSFKFRLNLVLNPLLSSVTKTYMWNIQNLDNPILINTHYHPHNSIDHNQYVRGRFTYQANYESGMYI